MGAPVQLNSLQGQDLTPKQKEYEFKLYTAKMAQLHELLKMNYNTADKLIIEDAIVKRKRTVISVSKHMFYP